MEEQAGLQAVKEEEEDLGEELEKRRKTPAEEEEAEEDEDEDALPHSEILDIFEEGLARLVQDPLLCDLPIQVGLLCTSFD